MDETEGNLHRFARDDGGLGGDEGGFDLGAGDGGQERGKAEDEQRQEEAGKAHGREI
jgi:hypothetical protein